MTYDPQFIAECQFIYNNIDCWKPQTVEDVIKSILDKLPEDAKEDDAYRQISGLKTLDLSTNTFNDPFFISIVKISLDRFIWRANRQHCRY